MYDTVENSIEHLRSNGWDIYVKEYGYKLECKLGTITLAKKCINIITYDNKVVSLYDRDITALKVLLKEATNK